MWRSHHHQLAKAKTMRMKNIAHHSMRRIRRVAQFHNICPDQANIHGYTVHLKLSYLNGWQKLYKVVFRKGLTIITWPIMRGPCSCTSHNIKKKAQDKPRGLTEAFNNVKVSFQGGRSEDQDCWGVLFCYDIIIVSQSPTWNLGDIMCVSKDKNNSLGRSEERPASIMSMRKYTY